MKDFLYDKEISYEESGMEEYEMYILYHRMKEKGINEDFFLPLMEEEE